MNHSFRYKVIYELSVSVDGDMDKLNGVINTEDFRTDIPEVLLEIVSEGLESVFVNVLLKDTYLTIFIRRYSHKKIARIPSNVAEKLKEMINEKFLMTLIESGLEEDIRSAESGEEFTAEDWSFTEIGPHKRPSASGAKPAIKVSHYEDPGTNLTMVTVPDDVIVYRGFRNESLLAKMDTEEPMFFSGEDIAKGYAQFALRSYRVKQPIHLMLFDLSNFKRLLAAFPENKVLSKIIRKAINIDSPDVACYPFMVKVYDELFYCSKGDDHSYWAMELAKELEKIGIVGWYVAPDTVENIFTPVGPATTVEFLHEEIVLSHWKDYLESKPEELNMASFTRKQKMRKLTSWQKFVKKNYPSHSQTGRRHKTIMRMLSKQYRRHTSRKPIRQKEPTLFIDREGNRFWTIDDYLAKKQDKQVTSYTEKRWGIPISVEEDELVYRFETRKNKFDGKVLHREGGEPAVIKANGDQEWWVDGKRHREGGQPAVVHATGDREWWVDGKQHRVGGQPAVVRATGVQEWWVDGKRHRENDLPAVEAEGHSEWWVNGKQHRDGGKPAEIWPDVDTEEWWVKGKRHRLSGPAIQTDQFSNWFINGKVLSRTDHRRFVQIIMKRRIEVFCDQFGGDWAIKNRLFRFLGVPM